MLPFTLKPEPANFETLVRIPGQLFLKGNSNPSSSQFQLHDYWTKVIEDLAAAFDHICCYSSISMRHQLGPSTDHFLCKSTHPQLAYEWSNYRFCCRTANEAKSTNTGILDPFMVGAGQFAIDFTRLSLAGNRCLVTVVPGPNCAANDLPIVQRTIRVLKLNEEKRFLEQRRALFELFDRKRWSAAQISEFNPFLGQEIIRQGIQPLIP